MGRHVLLTHLHELLGSARSARLWWPSVALFPETVGVGRAVSHVLALVDEGRRVVLPSADGHWWLTRVLSIRVSVGGRHVLFAGVVAGEPLVGVGIRLDGLGSTVALNSVLIKPRFFCEKKIRINLRQLGGRHRRTRCTSWRLCSSPRK